MFRIFVAVAQVLCSLLRAPLDLALENAALRQQLAVLRQKTRRPRVHRVDRLFWVLLRPLWSPWAEVLIIVKPQTVVRWHHQGFRAYWRWKSRHLPRIMAEWGD